MALQRVQSLVGEPWELGDSDRLGEADMVAAVCLDPLGLVAHQFARPSAR